MRKRLISRHIDIKRLISRLLDSDYTPFANVERLAVNAKTLTNNSAYLQARENALMRIVASWIATAPDQVSKREQLYAQICAWGDMHSELAVFIHNQEKDEDNA